MNRIRPIIITLLASVCISIAPCSPAGLKTAPASGILTAWDGRWESSVFTGSSGGIHALFPDPLPRGGGFTVEVSITYGEGADRSRTALTTVMAGEYDDRTGTLRFRGTITETGRVVNYAAVPNRDFTEFTGEYISLRPDDRGTFFIAKKR